MRKPFGGRNLDTAIRIVIPFAMVYAVYVFTAGEQSPGGGFQAGAVLALSMLFLRLVKGDAISFKIPLSLAVCISGIGAFFYCLTGWLSLLNGGQFLEYSHLPIPGMHGAHLHEAGIFLIEAGVTVCVMMTIITILEALLKREDFES